MIPQLAKSAKRNTATDSTEAQKHMPRPHSTYWNCMLYLRTFTFPSRERGACGVLFAAVLLWQAKEMFRSDLRVYCMINMQSSGMCRRMTCVPFITCIFFKHHPRGGGLCTMIHCCANGCTAGARSHGGARSATRGRRRGRRGAWHLCNTTIARLLFYLYVQNSQRTHNTHNVGARKKKKKRVPSRRLG